MKGRQGRQPDSGPLESASPARGFEMSEHSDEISFSAHSLSSSYRDVTAFLLLWFTPHLDGLSGNDKNEYLCGENSPTGTDKGKPLQFVTVCKNGLQIAVRA